MFNDQIICLRISSFYASHALFLLVIFCLYISCLFLIYSCLFQIPVFPPVLHEADLHDHRGVDGYRHHGRRHVGEVQSARV